MYFSSKYHRPVPPNIGVKIKKIVPENEVGTVYCSKIFWFLNFRVMSGRARKCNFYGNNHNHHHHHQQKKSFKKQQNRNKTSYYDSNKALWLPWPPVLPGFSTLFSWKKYLVMSAVDHYLLLIPGDLKSKPDKQISSYNRHVTFGRHLISFALYFW